MSDERKSSEHCPSACSQSSIDGEVSSRDLSKEVIRAAIARRLIPPVVTQQYDDRAVPPCVNPLVHLTFADWYACAKRAGVLLHPLHTEGFPTVVDWHSTLPVDDRSHTPSSAESGRAAAWASSTLTGHLRPSAASTRSEQ